MKVLTVNALQMILSKKAKLQRKPNQSSVKIIHKKPGPSKENIFLSDIFDMSDCENESQIPEEEKCCHCHKYYVDRNEHGVVEITQ